MAFSIVEKWESGAGSIGENSNDTLRAIVTGLPEDLADDPFTATKYAATQFPAVSRLGNSISNLARERIAPYRWLFTATYKSATGTPQTNDSKFSFTTGGQTQKITHSRKTIQMYPLAGADGAGGAPNFKQGINVTEAGIEGLDIHVRSFDFKTTFYLPYASVTEQYIDNLFKLTDCVNSDSVTVVIRDVEYQFDAGELLFLGAEGSERSGFPDFELTLNWSAIPNESSLTVGDNTGIEKKGWEYLWVYSQASTDQTAKFGPIHVPSFVYIEQIYDYQALTPLLQGTSFGAAPPWLTLDGNPATPLTGANPQFGITVGPAL